jgi:hypothetical protein
VNPICWYHRASGRIRFDGTNLSSSWIPLYAKQEWSGLTDDEIKEIVGRWGPTPISGFTRKLFDQIEAKLKEKNT